MAGDTGFVSPGIVIPGGAKELAFPLTAAGAKAIIAAAEPAPYGMGDETRLDDRVRKCWQIDASSLAWTNPAWARWIGKTTASIASKLGVAGKVVAEPYKLLLYEKGGFFLPHRDTEKIPGMFGSLVVGLPSAHTGGALRIRHGGSEKVIQFGGSKREVQNRRIRYAGFFADCEHEVEKVAGGFRLCLTYNLAVVGRRAASRMPPSPDAALDAAMDQLKAELGADLAAVLLDHRYTEASFSPRKLKGDDRQRADAILASARRAGLVANLALLSLHQIGELEGGGFDRYGGYGDDDEDYGEDDGDAGGTMGEIYEESLKIDQWYSPKGRALPFGGFSIQAERIISGDEIGLGDPEEKEGHAYTGNEGCSMEYWYRRAAVIVWEEAAEPEILTRYNFGGASAALLGLAKRKGAAKDRRFLALARALISDAERRLGDQGSCYGLGAIALGVLEAIAEAGSEELWAECGDDLMAKMLAEAGVDVWRKLLSAFGHRAADRLLGACRRESLSELGGSLIAALDAVLGIADPPAAIVADLAAALPDALAIPPCEEPSYFALLSAIRADAGITAVVRWHVAIAAAPFIREAAVRRELKERLWAGGELGHLRKVLCPAFFAKSHQRFFGRKSSPAGALLKSAIGALAAEVASPLDPYPDFARPVPPEDSPSQRERFRVGFSDAGAAEIAELRAFLRDPAATEHRFSRREVIRQSIEAYIFEHELDVNCRTERSGSPYTLICRKNDNSYRRAVIRRAEDKVLLASLRKLEASGWD
ncbi:MAG: 2OG-Fe(II) oxygenase [Verrucomicrobiales bacterium]